MTISTAEPSHERTVMPKGIPKTDGEKLNDKFDAGYQKMRRGFKKGRAEKKAGKPCAGCGNPKCACNK